MFCVSCNYARVAKCYYRSFTQYCDLSRQFDPSPSPNTTNGLPNGTVVPPYKGPGVDTFILDFKRIDLLDFSTRSFFA